jgi:hypothetical protein
MFVTVEASKALSFLLLQEILFYSSFAEPDSAPTSLIDHFQGASAYPGARIFRPIPVDFREACASSTVCLLSFLRICFVPASLFLQDEVYSPRIISHASKVRMFL